jgi:hypothetical protein
MPTIEFLKLGPGQFFKTCECKYPNLNDFFQVFFTLIHLEVLDLDKPDELNDVPWVQVEE